MLLRIIAVTVAVCILPTDVQAATLQERAAERRAARLASLQQLPSHQPVRFQQRRTTPLTVSRVPQQGHRRSLRRDALRRRTEARERRARRIAERRKNLLEQRVEITLLKEEVIAATNRERERHGVGTLTYNATLERSAQEHAEDMLHHAYFSHENLQGESSGDRIREEGYGEVSAQERCNCVYRIYMGENLAKGQATVEEVIEDWLESPLHRKALLSPDYTEIGIGIIDDIWVQNFGGVVVQRSR